MCVGSVSLQIITPSSAIEPSSLASTVQIKEPGIIIMPPVNGGRKVDESVTVVKRKPMRKQGFWRTVTREPSFRSFKLDVVYEAIFKKKPELLHEAEADVQTLFHAALATEEFLNEVDCRAIPFSKIEKLW